MGTQRTNQIKKEFLWNRINDQGKWGMGYNEEKLIAKFCLDCNTSKKTALEMLGLFQNSDRIIRKDGIIYSKRFFNEDLSIKTENFEPEPSKEEIEVNKEVDDILNGN